MNRSPYLVPLAACAAVVSPGSGQARITRFVVEQRTLEPGIGRIGAREVLRGHFEGEVSASDPHDAIITDLKLGRPTRRGRATYSASFVLSYPVSPRPGGEVLMYDVPNRGHAPVPTADDHIHLASGWQGDIPAAPDRLTARVPVARHSDGRPVQGAAFVRFVDMAPGAASLPLLLGLDGDVPAPRPASLNRRSARLFRQRSDTARQEDIPRSAWRFADCATQPFPGRPDPAHICLREGFDPRYAYGLSYVARDPPVLGVGFAATRDLVSFLRHVRTDDQGAPNPVADRVRWTIAHGVSQAGNYLRSFIHLGFNADDQGRVVFDGVHSDIAARLIPLNVRFGNPSGAADTYELGSEGVLWWGRYDDRARGLGPSSLLDRCGRTRTCPKIIETVGASEIWGLRLSPDLVGTDAARDIPLPPNVRRYYLSGVTHGGGAGGFDPDWSRPTPYLSCLLADNPNPSADTVRALDAALLEWVTRDVAPPPSRYPRKSDGDLVAPEAAALGFPRIPGAPSPDGLINPFVEQALGPLLRRRDLSGVVARQPPRIGRTFPSLAPRLDQDGNEIGGIASVQQRVPLGTYLGWNVSKEGYHKGGRCSFLGGYIPFAKTRAEREARGDPRPSLEERYGTRATFIARVEAAAADLEAERFLTHDDAVRIVREAKTSRVLTAP